MPRSLNSILGKSTGPLFHIVRLWPVHYCFQITLNLMNILHGRNLLANSADQTKLMLTSADDTNFSSQHHQQKNVQLLTLILHSRSLINTIKSTGPKTEPWGTPLKIFDDQDCSPLTITTSSLSNKKDSIHLNSFGMKSYHSNFEIRSRLSTLSEAFSYYRYIVSVSVPCNNLS